MSEEMEKLNALLIGGGNIARILLEELCHMLGKVYYFDFRKTGLEAEYLESFEVPEDVDVVVECAGIEAVKQHALGVLKAGRDLYVISSGAFAYTEFLERLLRELENSVSKIFVPSGAIGGLDIIRALGKRVSGVDLIMRKPPVSLGYKEFGSQQRVVFEGRVEEAIEKFPQNVNVAVTLLLAVRDSKRINIRVIADPSIERNIHELVVRSSAGDYRITHENRPSPNPRTSYLAALSLASCIEKRFERFVVGG